MRKRAALVAVAAVGVGAPIAQAKPEPQQKKSERHLAAHEAMVKQTRRERRRLMSVARKQLGDPYVWGAAGPNAFDCSGLVWYVYRKVGKWFPRITAAALERVGKRVYGRLHPGDIIVVHGGSHVVLYAGDGMVIHAPHSGTVVQYAPVSRYRGSAVAIRRIIPWRG